MTQPVKFRWLLPAGLLVVPAVHSAYAVQYSTAEQAQRAAFPHATSFAPLSLSASDIARAMAADSADPIPSGWSPKVWEARSGDQRLGWLIVDQVIGKTELITYSVALGPDGSVMSLDILEYRESHGNEVRLPGWRKQFVGKRTSDTVRLDSDIRNISGATLSCRHVTEGVHRLLQFYARALKPAAP